MLTEPVVPVDSTTLLTNSAKYAHYAPGLVNRKVRFNTLAACVEAATTGEAAPPPAWLARTIGYQRHRGFSTYTGLSASLSASGGVNSQMGTNPKEGRAVRIFGHALHRYNAVQLVPVRSLLRFGLKAFR